MIGIFDSGCGGLTVLRAIKNRLPHSDILYFGDTNNAPYGTKSREELGTLTINAIGYLREAGATSIVSACNSVSASLAVSLFDAFSISPQHLIEMVGPTVADFRGSFARIALCATQATITSGIYQNAFRMIGKEISVLAIPALAGAIEAGKSESELEQIIAEAFRNRVISDFDVLILACTHYPLVTHLFHRVLGEQIAIFDPAEAVAERVESQFWPREAGSGEMKLAMSKDSEAFRALVAQLFPHEQYALEVIQ